jgi:hypothetical protein
VLQQLRVFDSSRSATPKAKKKPKSKKPTLKKSGWKSEWHKSPAYQTWQAKIVPKAQKPKAGSAEEQEFLEARNEAFRVRDAIKAKWKSEEETSKAASASAEQDSSSKTPPAGTAEGAVENEDVAEAKRTEAGRLHHHQDTFKLKSINTNRTRKRGSRKNPTDGRKIRIADKGEDQVDTPAAQAADQSQSEGASQAGQEKPSSQSTGKPEDGK